MAERVVVIGSGLGGLECGFILAKQGMQVTVLEKEHQTGGCLQTFMRGGQRFDTGLHYVGGLGEGESLRPLFDYFGLMDLPWKRLDEDCFDEIFIGEQRFAFAQGHERFVETLAESFPKEKANLQTYAEMLRQVGLHIWDSMKPREAEEFYGRSLFARSAYEWLEATIGDPLLRKVLSGTSLKLELDKARLPLYVFAQINNSFIQSAWRLVGGGSQIADRLTEQIEQMGGEVRTRAEVTELIEKDGKIVEVEINGEERIPCDYVISDAHPAVTLGLVKESSVIRPIYRKRIERLQDSVGMFTVNIRLRPNTMKYLNRNLYFHLADADLWNPRTDRVESMLVHFYPPEDGQPYAGAIDLLTPMRMGDLGTLSGCLRNSMRAIGSQSQPQVDSPKATGGCFTPCLGGEIGRSGHRSEAYEAFKREKAQECIRFASKYMPGLEEAVDAYWTSTPLTYAHYTATRDGSAFGITKDWQSPMTTVLSPRTPIENLLLTGQSLNLHGILGTSMTSLFTTAKLLGKERIREEVGI